MKVQMKTMRAELSTLRDGTKENKNKEASSSAKMNRVLDELNRCKEALNRHKIQKKEDMADLRNQLTDQTKEIRKLERQRSELINAFKKQGQLIEILKQQKLHLEAARLLQFTEEEFSKLIESGL